MVIILNILKLMQKTTHKKLWSLAAKLKSAARSLGLDNNFRRVHCPIQSENLISDIVPIGVKLFLQS